MDKIDHILHKEALLQKLKSDHKKELRMAINDVMEAIEHVFPMGTIVNKRNLGGVYEYGVVVSVADERYLWVAFQNGPYLPTYQKLEYGQLEIIRHPKP